MDNIHLEETETNQRLDKVLKNRFPEYSRTYFQYLIENGAVTVNGRTIKKKDQGKLNDEIAIYFLAGEEIKLTAEDIPLEIIYEDDDLLAINKPAGIVVHPAPGHKSGTVVNGILHYLKGFEEEEATVRPGIVHRLDMDTTGVLLIAKHPLCHRNLVELFSSRKIKKTYLGITYGNPGEQTINSPIKRHAKKRKQMICDPDGKEAITLVKPLKITERQTLLEIKPVTGRTHQIRVHLQSVKTPIVADPLYGRKEPNIRHQLHAHQIEFIHPIKGEKVVITAPIPEDMERFIKNMAI